MNFVPGQLFSPLVQGILTLHDFRIRDPLYLVIQFKALISWIPCHFMIFKEILFFTLWSQKSRKLRTSCTGNISSNEKNWVRRKTLLTSLLTLNNIHILRQQIFWLFLVMKIRKVWSYFCISWSISNIRHRHILYFRHGELFGFGYHPTNQISSLLQKENSKRLWRWWNFDAQWQFYVQWPISFQSSNAENLGGAQ